MWLVEGPDDLESLALAACLSGRDSRIGSQALVGAVTADQESSGDQIAWAAVNAPSELRASLQPMSKMALIDRCAGLRPGPLPSPGIPD